MAIMDPYILNNLHCGVCANTTQGPTYNISGYPGHGKKNDETEMKLAVTLNSLTDQWFEKKNNNKQKVNESVRV